MRAHQKILTYAALSLVHGCSLDASQKLACARASDCVSGFTCLNNRCETLLGTHDAGSGLAGDWFNCLQTDSTGACTQVDNDGTRFNADGTWLDLRATGVNSTLDPGETYCEQIDRHGSYALVGDTLTETGVDGSEALMRVFTNFSLQGDTFVGTYVGVGNQKYQRIVPTRSRGACI
jgi:hypothetical protein